MAYHANFEHYVKLLKNSYDTCSWFLEILKNLNNHVYATLLVWLMCFFLDLTLLLLLVWVFWKRINNIVIYIVSKM
jgi:hypothetical protein